MRKRVTALACALVLCGGGLAHAQPAAPGEVIDVEVGEADGGGQPPPPIDVSVFGNKDVPRIGGSAHRVDEKTLERFEDDNVHTLLKRIPGVYVRGEDGYGLRPNIGLRGANSDRSKKITLLEDGVLFGPAPYAAPAAYYFPIMTRMIALEVFKGASALRHGPNTIGGAINVVTRPIPYGHKFAADLAAGSYYYGKGHGYYGYGDEYWGVLIEGVRLRSDGFKALDATEKLGSRPNTGFDKTEFMFKARVNTDPSDTLYNQVSIKLGYSHETSNETYLGLSDADFRADPYRRYAASQLDRMKWDRFQIEVSHDLIWQKHVKIHTVIYRHDFSRAWFKLNRFAGGSDLYDLLRDPAGGKRSVFYDVLRGAQDSASGQEQLMAGSNDRSFVSQGIQSSGQLTLPKVGPLEQRLRFGARLHYDRIVRHHTEDPFSMTAGELLPTGDGRLTSADNTASALAFSASLEDEIGIDKLIITPGVRFEYITTDFESRLSGAQIEGKQWAILPGVGAVYSIVDELSVLAGVHHGFSPVAPGQNGNTKPEVANNYEFGARFSYDWANTELVGFVSDYANIIGQPQSVGAATEEQFNGGKALIAGLEFGVNMEVPSKLGLSFPLMLSYTFTHSEFATEFESSNSQWGHVKEGDRLPYVPTHQFAITAGVLHHRWGGLNVGVTYVDAMLEVAAQGDIPSDELTDANTTLNATASVNLTREISIYVKGDNLLDTAYLVSRRPFGARPGSPRLLFGGVKVKLNR